MTDKDKLIELLVEAYRDISDYPIFVNLGELKDKENISEIASYLIKRGVTSQQWIPIEEETPGDMEECFVAYVVEDFDTHFFRKDRYFKNGVNVNGYHFALEGFDNDCVTHWMHIPKLKFGELQ